MILRLFTLLVVATAVTTQSHAAPTPDILVIFTDDQGVNDVSCYGSEIPTPNIDQLAHEGLKFNHFYAASSICTPSRFGLLTGRYPHRSQDTLTSALMFLEDVDAHRGIRADETTYVSQLQSVGYRTVLVGKWHLGHGEEQFWPTEHGFDAFYGHTGGCVDFFSKKYGNRPDWYRGRKLVEPDGYATDVITKEAVRVLHGQVDSDQPLYLQVSYNAPHFGKAWDEDAGATKNIMQPKPADLEQVADIGDPLRRAFAAKVVGMDDSIGKLLQTLKATRREKDTIVIFMTDHGGDPRYGGSNLPLRGGKATLYEGGIRVPCLVRWPGRTLPGSVTDSVACSIDWAATFGDITGFRVTETDGRSLMPLITGAELDWERTLVWRTGAHQSLERSAWLAVRQADWKLVQPPGKQPMLFDLKNDPSEIHDKSITHPTILKRLMDSAAE